MAKKVILIVLGLILFIVGLGIAALGGVALAFGGRAGVVQSSSHAISTPTSAFVSDPARIRNSNQIGEGGRAVTVRVQGRNSPKPLFIGVGPAAQVTSYLNGASYDQVTDVRFSEFELVTSRVEGTGLPAAPGSQPFWVAQASGPNPQLNWPVPGGIGDYRVVVMNADGSRGVTLDVRLGLKIKDLFGIGLGALIGGGLLILLGLGLLVWGIVAKSKRPEAVAGAGTYPPPGQYPSPGPGPGPIQPPPGQPPPGQPPPGQPPPGQPPPGQPGDSGP